MPDAPHPLTGTTVIELELFTDATVKLQATPAKHAYPDQHPEVVLPAVQSTATPDLPRSAALNEPLAELSV